jgi:hypothetical protein
MDGSTVVKQDAEAEAMEDLGGDKNENLHVYP